MQRTFGIAVVVTIWMVLASGAAVAGGTNLTAIGDIDAFDANQGSGSQTNADAWKDLDQGLAGSGNQSVDIGEHANTGSGVQDNSISEAEDWEFMDNANGGSGAQVLNSPNSNGRDRTSSDIVYDMGSANIVATATLSSQVTENSLQVSDSEGGGADSSMSWSNGSGFSRMFGVSAIGISGGASASQNVSVNVTASVTAGGGN